MSTLTSDRSGMTKIAAINRDLLSSLWRGLKRHNQYLKSFLLRPVILYSAVCIVLIIFFYTVSIIDTISYGISNFANSLRINAAKISNKKYNAFSTLFYPPIVILMGIFMAVAVLLPKTVAMPKK
jgi:hypothetical protein